MKLSHCLANVFFFFSISALGKQLKKPPTAPCKLWGSSEGTLLGLPLHPLGRMNVYPLAVNIIAAPVSSLQLRLCH